MENPTGPPSSDKVMQTILKEKKSSCNTESKRSCCPSATADGEQHSFSGMGAGMLFLQMKVKIKSHVADQHASVLWSSEH